MKLVIAEKPEVAKDIAEAIISNASKNKDGYYEDNNYVVVSAFGHLLTLAEPETLDEKYKDRKNIDILPVNFHDWKKVAGDETYKKARLKLIGTLIKDKRFDSIIHAGDPDEEGQNLIDELLDFFNYKGTVYRVYVNDSIQSHILKEFENLKLNDRNMRAVGDSAYARQMADKSFGINESRLVSARLNTFLSVGRVQTPTLRLVVNRDEEIEAHKERFYYDIEASLHLRGASNEYDNIVFGFKPSKELLQEEKHVFEKSVMQNVGDSLKRMNTFCDFTEKEELQNPPLPFNQTELSAEMNSKYGYSLKKTLDLTQALREKYKLISYNRSDCQYLTEDHFLEASAVLECVFDNFHRSYPVDTSIKSKCFDDSKVSAHHGIVPVQVPVQTKTDLSKLTMEEMNVYEAICLRYIVQFMKPIKRIVSSCEIKGRTGTLYYIGKKIIDEGYLTVLKEDTNNKEEKQFIKAGKYNAKVKDVKLLEKKTAPQKHYTPATLVKDMCAISKYVKDERIKNILKEKDKDKAGEKGSIGTVATRAVIVENLIQRGYLMEKGKNLISTQLGRDFIHLLPHEISSPDITAEWWLIQEDIKNGIQNRNALIDKICDDFTKRKATAYQGQTISRSSSQERESLGNCLFCGKDVYEYNTKTGKKMWACSDKNCNFKLFDSAKRFNDVIKLNKTKVKSILKGKPIEAELTAKNGKKYTTKLEVVRNGNYINFQPVRKS